MTISIEQVKTAYRKLKRYVYYDKTDLRLRNRLAEFECASDFEARLSVIEDVVNSPIPQENIVFKNWLKEINFRIVPKRIKWGDSGEDVDCSRNGKFITNVTSVPHVEIDKINYFFDGPIELHLIAVLWIMFEGRFLDSQLGPECFGSRLLPVANYSSDNTASLFIKYHEQYSKWRDTGIRKAKHLLIKDRESVAILGLDFQEYFYRIRIDFNAVSQAINHGAHQDDSYGSVPTCYLLGCIQAICESYQNALAPFLKYSHGDLSSLDTGLPIGLCSSLILANWYLKEFDDLIKRYVRPAYYGRYVDDLLLVIPVAKDLGQSLKQPVVSFMNDVLVETGILKAPDGDRYEIASCPGLYLQQGKCILQYFDAKHLIAGLEKFQKKLEENGSDFLLLPVDEADNSLEDVAYELLYEGSVNKFRSVKGMSENRYELAKHLARQTILHLLTDDPPDAKVSVGLRKFFKGKNAIEFYDLWERVFTFFRISDDSKAAKAFDKNLNSEIKRIRYLSSAEITNKLVVDLQKHLCLSRAMADALAEPNNHISEFVEFYPIENFRNSNLIRHHFIRKPLLNYTTYSGALTTRNVDSRQSVDNRKLELSPRYLNFDECMLLAMSEYVDLQRKSEFAWATEIYEMANKQESAGVHWSSVTENEESIDA